VSEAITPFRLSVPEAELTDLRARLDRTRWPEKETVGDWSQGSPLDRVQALCAYWRTSYDWRRCEARLNALGQFRTHIDGLDIHFLHVASPHPRAMPLLITHGWPGSVIEFLKVIGPLTDPPAYGGDPADAFHVIAPSLPGFGFSQKPAHTGWGVPRIAAAWVRLMERLGYHRWLAQGGDWGAAVTTAIGALRPAGCAAIHVNMPLVYPTAADREGAGPRELDYFKGQQFYRDWDSGYAKLQSTRPQSLGYGLVDSPAGLAAWIYEKYQAWTDNTGAPEDALSHDEMLDNIMMYWLPGAGASAARLYWESFSAFASTRLELPVGVSIYPREITRPTRTWAERFMSDIIHWRELDRGGHFAAWEEPDLYVSEIRSCFAQVR
jgi:pimeloyl-ACP methyl ester carboxylesterase